MMKQTATLTVLKKITFVFGFFITSSVSPLWAQSNNNQVTTLLELQALRQEVAELRDMVERQQYEMRKLQNDIKKNSTAKTTSSATNAVPTPAQSNVVSNIINGNARNQTLPSNTAQTSTDQTATPLNYQSGGRLSVPAQGQGGVRSSNNGVTSSAIPNSLPSNTGGVIDASNVPTAPRATVNSQSTPQTSALNQAGRVVADDSNAVSHQAQRVFSTTQTPPSVANPVQGNLPATSSSTSTLPSSVEIRPVETIQPGSISTAPTAGAGFDQSNLGQAQQRVTNQAANLSTIPENDYYQQGFSLLKESKHDEAVMVFNKQIQQYPKGDLADDAYYWVAESLYVSRKLNLSKENFRAIIQGYPNSERAPDAMLKLAYIEQEQGNIIESRILLQEVIQFYPQSDAALSAKNRLSQIN